MFLLLLIFESTRTARDYLLIFQLSADSPQRYDQIWCKRAEGARFKGFVGHPAMRFERAAADFFG